MIAIRKILCPVDFTDTSREAIRWACGLARTFDATLALVHVYQPPGYALPEGVIIAGPKVMSDLLEAVERELARERATAEDFGAPRIETRAVQGVASQEIVRLAREESYDLIVMGTHGRTGLAHALLGSVAERVIRGAPCPVLTVRPRSTV